MGKEQKFKLIGRILDGLVIGGFILHFSTALAQVSLWEDHNPYSDTLRVGQLVQVMIDEKFVIDVDSEWERNRKLQIKLYPDNKNFKFLSNSEQSKVSAGKTRVRYKSKDRLQFAVMGIVEKAKGDDTKFGIRAEKSLVIDGKPTQITIQGLIDNASLENGRVDSTRIASFKMAIISEPPTPRDESIQLKPSTDAKVPPRAELSDAEKQQLLLRHIQEILAHFKK